MDIVYSTKISLYKPSKVCYNDNMKNMVEKGFELDKRINHALIVAGLGAAAVGAMVSAPAIVTFGALTAGGSIAGLAFTDRLKDGYESLMQKRAAKKQKLGQKITKDHFTLAA